MLDKAISAFHSSPSLSNSCPSPLTLLIKVQIGSCDTQLDKSRSAQQNVRDGECYRNVFIFEPKPVRAEKVISKAMIQPLHRREIDGGRWKNMRWERVGEETAPEHANLVYLLTLYCSLKQISPLTWWHIADYGFWRNVIKLIVPSLAAVKWL